MRFVISPGNLTGSRSQFPAAVNLIRKPERRAKGSAGFVGHSADAGVLRMLLGHRSSGLLTAKCCKLTSQFKNRHPPPLRHHSTPLHAALIFTDDRARHGDAPHSSER
ncbi:hypothetical protein JOB18_038950 [Solea senegalensis]|uniref:Uncharacterized protein n=1 Tax=Solea senegalensis TaxID=28829 RepID=A0AAV6SKS8_SOLSE|nr:hypothetical protein JOB18_038950 [Solea senegalensis]